MGVDTQFKTLQTVDRYEKAIARHGQYVRWTRGILCPCMNPTTMQPSPNCSMCKGRGRIYKTPDLFSVVQEIARHDGNGKVYPKYTSIMGTPFVWRKGSLLTLAAQQPADGSYIQLDPPYPKAHERVRVDYNFSPEIEVTAENSEVVGTNTLRTIATRFMENGKTFEGSISEVSRVYNATKDETYTVSEALKEYIYLQDMGTWEAGDVLEVDYKYVKPFNFLLIGISPRLRYEQPYILDEADSTLITPYWARVAPEDIITALASEQQGSAVVDPGLAAGNDIVRNYFDLAKILYVIDQEGNEYEAGSDVELYGRNELKWNITKPVKRYSVMLTYHPTFTALMNYSTLRTSENKSFANKINLILRDKTSNEVRY